MLYLGIESGSDLILKKNNQGSNWKNNNQISKQS